MMVLPGEDPSGCELWNYAMRFTKRAGNGELLPEGLQKKP
jgi:hypothetical protein